MGQNKDSIKREVQSTSGIHSSGKRTGANKPSNLISQETRRNNSPK